MHANLCFVTYHIKHFTMLLLYVFPPQIMYSSLFDSFPICCIHYHDVVLENCFEWSLPIFIFLPVLHMFVCYAQLSRLISYLRMNHTSELCINVSLSYWWHVQMGLMIMLVSITVSPLGKCWGRWWVGRRGEMTIHPMDLALLAADLMSGAKSHTTCNVCDVHVGSPVCMRVHRNIYTMSMLCVFVNHGFQSSCAYDSKEWETLWSV